MSSEKKKGIGLLDTVKKLRDIAEEDIFLSYTGSMFFFVLIGLLTGTINVAVGKYLVPFVSLLLVVAAAAGALKKISASWLATTQAEKEGNTFKSKIETQFQAGAVAQVLDTGIIFAEMVVGTLLDILADGVITIEETRRMAILIKDSKKYIGSTFSAIGIGFPDWAREWFGVEEPTKDNIPESEPEANLTELVEVDTDVVSMNPTIEELNE